MPDTSTQQDEKPGITVSHLYVSPAKRLLLEDVSFEVPWGTLCGIIGPQGAGKSTLLRTLALLQVADAGIVQIGGVDARRPNKDLLARIGYLPPFFAFSGHLTVGEYLDFHAASYGISSRMRSRLRADFLELMDLSDREEVMIDTLSPQEKRRLDLARCLVHDPDFLLLDDPTSDLKAQTRAETHAIIEELASMGKTVLIAARSRGDVPEMCSRMVHLESGRMMAPAGAMEVGQPS